MRDDIALIIVTLCVFVAVCLTGIVTAILVDETGKRVHSSVLTAGGR